ncbi:MAG: hypothetical protein HN465_01040, partial [Nitrospina sp.]|nr:hypothetical protein [Nitrospina sp.]
MRTATLEGIFLDPSFIIIFFVILGTIANILIGVSMLPEDKRKKRFKTHRFIFYLIIISYGGFLWFSNSPGESELFKYIVLAYFLFIIPLTRRINVTFHAILA